MKRPLMGRPVMNPTFQMDEPATAGKPKWWMKVVMPVAGGIGWVFKKLFSKPLRIKRAYEVETPVGRLLRGMMYRIMFLPLLLVVVTSVLVFTGTHPRVPAVSTDPASHGIYYDPMDFKSEDGTELKAWVVPLVDARRVLLHKERLFDAKHPAVILAHDYGQTPEQVLPLVGPLHEDGVIVVAVGLRGVGVEKQRVRGQTFGINEAKDVAAAIAELRKRPFVDPDRIAVVGIGTGANAMLLCADRDPQLKAIALVDPLESHLDALALRLGPSQFGTQWLQNLTKWTFEICYLADFDEIDMNRFQGVMASRPFERINGGIGTDGKITDMTVRKIRAFCRTNLPPGGRSLVTPAPSKGKK
jgi:pimeloyl-ACP methyl ester carboxylesterase